MFIAVRDFMVTNTAIWTASSGMTTAVTSLTTHIDNIDTYSEGQQEDSKGATTTKGIKRDTLVAKIVKVADGLRSFANATGNTTLAGQSKVVKSQLDGMPDTILSDKAQSIRNLGNTNIAGLADYNVLPADVTALNTARTAFNADIQKPKNIIGTKKANTTNLKNEFLATIALFDNVMDPLVRTYKEAENTFVLEYFNNREIYNIGSVKVAARFTIDESVDHMPLALVQILVTPGDIKKKTTEKGSALIKTLATGSYNAAISKAGFVSQNTTFYVNAGATTQVLVSLVAI
ncbi:MAG: hypothetical protein WAU21_03070 [Chitinophagales bacterium]|nr:hypothetical protein [Bacteroidota bacterium]